VVDVNDTAPLALALTDPAGYTSAYPGCDIGLADLDGSGVADALDIQSFVNVLLGS